MFQRAIPVLHVNDSAEAETFYCQQLGFERKFSFRIDEQRSDPCYLGLVRENAEIHVSSFSGDAVPGGVVYLVVDDVDQLFDQWKGNGIEIELSPTDQTWGNREMYVKDPTGNCIRFVQPIE